MGYFAKVSLSTLQGNDQYKNEKGNHECVTLVQQAANAPNTSLWKRGCKVIDARQGEISAGTVIATFDLLTNRYPTTARHAAIYESHNTEGITVYDQWNRQGEARRRTIRLKNLPERNVDDAKYYYVVE